MGDEQFMHIVEQSAHDLLVWVGFGALVGLAAKAIMPGREPGGAIGTLLMGIAGSVIGCGLLMFFWDAQRVSPISPIGFLVGAAGAFLLLGIDRVLADSFFTEAEDDWRFRRLRRRRVLYDD